MSEPVTLAPEQDLREWLLQLVIGTVEPRAVLVTRDVDSEDREAWFFHITLADPTAGPTWSPLDLNQFQQAARDKALQLGLSWPWYLRFRPETEMAQADDG